MILIMKETNKPYTTALYDRKISSCVELVCAKLFFGFIRCHFPAICLAVQIHIFSSWLS